MENDIFVKAAQVAQGITESSSQAEVVVEQTPVIAESQVSAEVAVEPNAEAQVANPSVEAIAEAENKVSNEAFNYWTELDQKSEGLVKDEETLKGVIERAKSYEDVIKAKEELEKNQFKPANDYIKTLNDLVSGGASKDQIKAFGKLSEYGNLEELDPFEAKVAKMVLKDGYSEEMARKIVNRDFNFSRFDLEIPEEKDEADILREELRISAKSDLETLKEYQKDLSVVVNTEKESAEKAQLEQIATISSYNKTVEQEAPKVARLFPEKLSYELKIGEETVPYDLSIDKSFMENDLPKYVDDYFRDSLDSINETTISEAFRYAQGEYLLDNLPTILGNAYSKGKAEGEEKTVNKYENRSGLPKAEENTVVVQESGQLNDFIRQAVYGKQ